MKKIAKTLNTIYAIGVISTLFLGGSTLLGYIVALLVGGEFATELCATIYKEIFPIIIQTTSVFVGLGLIGMYFQKTKALSLGKKQPSDK